LIEAGFEYDSSVFPVRHDVYGIRNFPKDPHLYTGSDSGSFVEFPISACDFFGYELPVAGGGYFRLYPYWFSWFCLNSVNQAGRTFVFYLHPWEVDPTQPIVANINWKSKFRHYNNLDKCESRFASLLKDFNFSSMENALVEKGFLQAL